MSALWYVKLQDGDVEPLTLDELDEAFQAGHINSNTMVLAAGATQWAKLGELAGLDQPPPAVPQQRQHVPYAPMPNSLRPVSVDLGDFGDDDTPFTPPKKSKKWLVGVVLVVGVLGFAGFEAQRSGAISISRLMSGGSSAAAAAMPAPPPATPPAPPPEVASPVAAPAAAPSPTTGGNPLSDPSARFTQDQKDKLAAADKQHEAKIKTHVKTHGAVTAHTPSSSKSKSMGFTTGGNKFDPLNATIP